MDPSLTLTQADRRTDRRRCRRPISALHSAAAQMRSQKFLQLHKTMGNPHYDIIFLIFKQTLIPLDITSFAIVHYRGNVHISIVSSIGTIGGKPALWQKLRRAEF